MDVYAFFNLLTGPETCRFAAARPQGEPVSLLADDAGAIVAGKRYAETMIRTAATAIFTHAFPGHKRTASLWFDIEQGKHPHFGLKSRINNLTYSAESHGAITVCQTPRIKSVPRPARPSSGVIGQEE